MYSLALSLNRAVSSNSFPVVVFSPTDLCARLEVSKDGSCSKGLFQSIERMSALVGEVPWGIFLSKPSQGNHNIKVIEYEGNTTGIYHRCIYNIYTTGSRYHLLVVCSI